jgi:hypothetical protein
LFQHTKTTTRPVINLRCGNFPDYHFILSMLM